MAYRQPGIEVVQEFQALTPALVLPALPVCIIGPAFQIQDLGDAGAYAGVSKACSYPSLANGAIVDIAELSTTELASTQKPISVKLTNAYVNLSEGTAGTTVVGSQTFTSEVGADHDFAKVTPAVGKYYYVKITDALSADLGTHLIVSKTVGSNVEVKLASVMKVASSAVNYTVLEKKASITYDRANFTTMGIVATTSTMTLPADLPSQKTRMPLPEYNHTTI